MIESLLVADVGVIATRIIADCRRLGVKSIGVRLSKVAVDAVDGRGQPVGAPERLADDVVLLADLAELHDGRRVLGAAVAAGVSGIHPGRGPLRADTTWAAAVRAQHLLPVVSSGAAPSRPAALPEGTVEVTFVADATGYTELATVERRNQLLRSPAQGNTESVRHLARATVAAHQLRGLVSVAVLGDEVVSIDGGLPVGQRAIELSTGLDLLRIQLAAAANEPLPTPPGDPTRVAVSRGRLDVVDDARVLDSLNSTRLRLDITPLHARGHQAVVWATGGGSDDAAALRAIQDYVDLAAPGPA